MGARVSLSVLLTGTALSGPVRSSLNALLSVNALAGPVRASGHYLLVSRSYNRSFLLNLLESNSAIYGVDSYDVNLTVPPTPESNPFKPLVPEMLSAKVGVDGYAYLQENQETLREQHNLTQAGDTTFPYQLTLASHSIQHYKLGSVGRFYHPDYGVLQARYVQFSGMIVVDTPHCPVGLFKNADALDWIVTNDYEKSNPDLVVGISAPWILPVNADYGWVIVDGPILQQVSNESIDFAIGEPLVWSASGKVSNIASGKILGRRVAKTTAPNLLAGSMWVRTESFSEAQINALITNSTRSLLNELQALERQIALLPSAAVLRTLQRTVTSLRTALTNEASARIASDLRLNERISNLSFVTIAQLNAALASAASAVASEFADVATQLETIRNAISTLSTRVGVTESVQLTLQDRVDWILVQLANLYSLTRNKFPVVDGSVPPNLVYLDDGSLVYVEE
jgi:hypothetical protein